MSGFVLFYGRALRARKPTREIDSLIQTHFFTRQEKVR